MGRAAGDTAVTRPPTIDGHELTEEDLERLRQQHEAFDHIEVISDEVRELIAERSESRM
jgi:hypothetical protein